ncbi:MULTISPECIES: hypothetical protein [unclassified Duganella]|uniref:hypothetical protein n=1 Tax=unclassified Duganella TaxID=2636909 RepID=UPI00088CB050|nr:MULTISPECIES: hypothetical protein [unclassified Duganella]SDF58726.1 hypothetical protein SAMN05216320_101653 [Duganella sp. OV458]SDI69879.1 hypothetical protein SAMN05428973_101762 [Duganella sp. OV510]
MNLMSTPQQASDVDAVSRPPLLLSLSFDVDQISSQLDWTLTPDVQPVTGADSGCIAFTMGDVLNVAVNGYGRKGNFYTFQIVDCCIITKPALVQIGRQVAPLYAAPSPFVQALGACYPLSLDFRCTAQNYVGADQKHRRVTHSWKHQLDVNHAPGRWELSFVLTVRIMRELGHVTETRVFSFDPECQVGDGTEPDLPHGGA